MPTKTRTVRFTVNIEEGHYSGGDMPGFLDMLRYEGGQVIAWERTDRVDGKGMSHLGYRVTIEVEATRFQPDRWASFMLFPKVI